VSFPVRLPFRKILAASLAFLILLQPAADGWAALPAVSAAPRVHLIQDIHSHAEAQRDIAATLERLRQENGGRLRVGIEGASGEFDFRPYRAFPSDAIRRDVSRELLDDDKIAGPVHAALIEKKFSLHGLETTARYVANVDAYRRAAPLQAGAADRLARARRDLSARKAAVYPRALRALDDAAAAHRAGRATLGDYLDALSTASGDAGLAVETFLTAHRMERTLDFARVESEKRRLVEALVRAFDTAEVRRVRDWVLSASSEGMGAGRRFDYLFHAARSKGLDTRAFPALADYIRYLHLADAIDADRLFAETAELERTTFAQLSEGFPGAAALVAADRRLTLTEKIVRFELTREEWNDYRDARPAGPAALAAAALAPFEDFYRVAEERDAELAGNVRRARVDAIVVGGFHTAGLVRALKAAGIAVDVLRPRISSAAPEKATGYLSGFAARKTPLERLFTRWKLFLALPAVIGVERPLVPSVNDDAPWRFVESFRRRAAATPSLEPGVSEAARELLDAQDRGAIGAEFDAAIRRFAGIPGRLGRRWLSETVFYLAPLSIGLATGNLELMAVGLAVKLFVLPAAHSFTDGDRTRERFAGRVAWSGAFLTAYLGFFAALAGVGVPPPMAAVLALAAPAYTHRANHRGIFAARSWTERFLFSFLRLPRVAMSTGGAQDFLPEEQALVRRVMDETEAALTAWRARSDRTNAEFQADPVIDLLERYHAEALAEADPKVMAAFAWGITNALFRAKLKPLEMQVRARRDETWCFMRGMHLADMAQRLNNRLVPAVYQQTGMMYLAVEPGLVDAIRRGTEEAFSEAPRRLLSRAIEDWRAGRAARLEMPDMGVRLVWTYIRSLVGTTQPEYRALIVRGAITALTTAQLTPEEARERAAIDIEEEFSTASQIVAPIYRDVAVELRGRRRVEQADAILSGLRVAIRLTTRITVSDALSVWRDSSTDVERRSHDQITAATVTSFVNADVKSEDYRMSVDGFAEAYAALAAHPADFMDRVENDIILASAFWDQSLQTDEKLLRAVMAVHRAVAQRLGGEVAAAVQSGQDRGWARAMRRQVAEGVRRTRAPARGAALIDMPAGFVRFAASQNISMANAAGAIRQGLMDASITDDEAVTWVRTNVESAMRGPLDPDGIERLRLVRTVAHELAMRLTALSRPRAGETLIDLTNVTNFVQRRVRAWKGAEMADSVTHDAEITAAMLRLAAADSIADNPGEIFDTMAQVIHEADLTPAQLQVRVTHEMEAAAARFRRRPLLPEMQVWSSQMMDPDFRALAIVYLGLSERYVREGDAERSHAILSALTEAALQMSLDDLDELHGRNFIIFLNTLAYACLRDDASDLARRAAAAILQLVAPSPEMPQVVGWVMDTLGEVNRQEGKPGASLRHGFEHTTLMSWRDIAEDFHSDAQEVKLMERMYTTAKMLFQTGSHAAARAYLTKALALIERRPRVRQMVDGRLVERMRGVEAASRLLLSRSTEELPPFMAVVQGTIGVQALEPTDDPEDGGFLYAILYETNIEMCRTGDARYYERQLALGEGLYRGDAYVQVRRINSAKSVRYRAGAPGADRPALEAELVRLYGTPQRPADMATQADVVDLSQYALARAGLGHVDEAAGILREQIARVSGAGFRALVDAEAANRLNGTLNTELAAVLSAANAAPAALVPHLVAGLTVEISDERVILSTHRLLDPAFTRVDVVLAACDLIVTAGDKSGYSNIARLNAAILARTLAPAAFPARLDTWKKSKSLKSIRERFDLIDSIEAAAWPGRQFALLRHDGEMEFHERLYRESLDAFGTRKGVSVFEEWRENWNSNQRELWLYAAQLARLGLMEESLAALRLARKWTADALKKFAPNKRMAGFPEDPGIMALPFALKSDKIVIREGTTLLQTSDAGRMRSFGPMVAISAERLGEGTDWKTDKEFMAAMDQASRLIERVSDPALRPLIEYVQSRLNRFSGRLTRGREALRRALANSSDDIDAVENRTRARVELAKYTMWDTSLMLGRRLSDAERMIIEAKPMPGYDAVHGGYQELVLAMFQFDPAEPVACAAVADRALALLTTAVQGGELNFLAAMGMPARLAELALLPSAPARVGEALTGLVDWTGGRAGDALALGFSVNERFARDPQAFLDQATSERFPNIHAADVNLWRVAAAQRLGDREQMRTELNRLVTDRRAFYPEAFHQSYLVEQLMESPLLRRAYLDAVAAVLGAFRAEEWKGRADSLRRLVDAAASVGEPQLVYLMDALSENKEFPARSALNGPEGLYARLEPHLTMEEWAERINLMDALNHDRSVALRAQALTLLGADAAGPLDLLVARKRFGPEAMARIGRAVATAREQAGRREFVAARETLNGLPAVLRNGDVEALHAEINDRDASWETEKARSAAALASAEKAYNRMDFTGTAALLDSIHRDLRTVDSRDLARRNAALLGVWAQYQSGDFDGALRSLSAVSASEDPVLSTLRRRIENVRLARLRLDGHRPQEAQITLNSMNGNVSDPLYESLRSEVIATNNRAHAAFDALRGISAPVGTSAGAVEKIRAGVAAVLAIDEEYETVMQFVIEKAQLFYDGRNYAGAQDVLFILVTESRIFDATSDSHSKFEKVRQRLERVRSLARAHEMQEWLTTIARLLRTKLDAETHAMERSAGSAMSQQGNLSGETFVFGPTWRLDRSGNIIVDRLAILQTEDGKPARYGDDDARQVPLPVAEAPFKPNLSFQIAFGTGENAVRLPVSYVRMVSAGSDNRLMFLPDATGLEILKAIDRKKTEGRLMYMADISTLTQVSALNIVLGYIERHILALNENRTQVHSMPVISRLLGLDVSPQVGAEDAPVPHLSEKFESDPTQTAAILTALRQGTEASAFQGPPGTGKTTTAVEIIRHMVRPGGPAKGRIVVVTAQAHAGVDNIALKIQEANVAIVRSASGSASSAPVAGPEGPRRTTRAESAQQRVTKKLQTTERERLERLMAVIENHHATGLGFAYCVTNNGLRGDRRCFDLLTLYFSGESMNEIRIRFSKGMKSLGGAAVNPSRITRPGDDVRRPSIQPVWAQEEAGQANPAETLAVPVAINADVVIAFGDQDQLSPGKFEERGKRLIRQEVAAGMTLMWGNLNRILSRAVLASIEISLFEQMYSYASRWAALAAGAGAGVITGFLEVSRRSHWVIVDSIVNVYYGDRLRHRDEDKARARWERIRKDTVVFVNSDGREEMDARDREIDFNDGRDVDQSDDRRGEPQGGRNGRQDSDANRSKRNFREVGEVIRSATYHLNGRSARDHSRRKAGDILILTPYKAQNRLINETLRWVAIANDFARRDNVSPAELAELAQIVNEHVQMFQSARLNPGEIRRVLSQFRSAPSQRRPALVEQLFDVVRPMYDLRFDGARTIGRDDLPEVDTPPEASEEIAEEAAPEEESLDEQDADVIEAKTVHRVQGQERKVVIISLVRSDELGFLAGKVGRRIINVATSRVEENLVLVYSRGMRPDEVNEMERRLTANFAQGRLSFAVLPRFPSDASPLASLRLAWGLSTGSAPLDRFIDQWTGPPVETVTFLAVLGLGLVAGNALVVAAGVFVKLVAFPVLHALPAWLGLRPTMVDVSAVAALAAVSVLLYVAAFFALTAGAGLPSSSAFWISMIAPTILHLANNNRGAVLVPADLGETKSLELDTIAGIEAQKSARLVDALAPPVRRAPVFRYGSNRPVRSGA